MRKGWMAVYDGYVSRGCKPISGKGFDIWWEWCVLHPPPPERVVEGVRVRREDGVVKVSGTSVEAVRQVVRGQRVAGERWVRVAHGTERRERKKSEGTVVRTGRVTKGRSGVRVRMDAGSIERMRRSLETRDVDRERAGVAEVRFGDG